MPPHQGSVSSPRLDIGSRSISEKVVVTAKQARCSSTANMVPPVHARVKTAMRRPKPQHQMINDHGG